MPRQYAFAPTVRQPSVDRAAIAAAREQRQAQAQQYMQELQAQKLQMQQNAQAEAGLRFATTEKRQQAATTSDIEGEQLARQKTAFELKQMADKAKREQDALKYFTVANVLESSIHDPRAFEHNPDVAAFWRKRYPDIDQMTPEQKIQLATTRRRYGQDLIDAKGVEASVLRAQQMEDAAKESERVKKELQEKALTAATERQTAGFDAAKELARLRSELAAEKNAKVIKPLDHVTVRKALIDFTGMNPQSDTIKAVADLVKNQGASLQEAMARVRVPVKGRDEKIMEPARAAFREASAKFAENPNDESAKAGLAAARETMATALQKTETPEDLVWDREAGTLVPVSALSPPQEQQPTVQTPPLHPDATSARIAGTAAENAMKARAETQAALTEAKRPPTIEDKYNLLAEVLRSQRNPNTGAPLTPAEELKVKAAMANFRKRLTTPE